MEATLQAVLEQVRALEASVLELQASKSAVGEFSKAVRKEVDGKLRELREALETERQLKAQWRDRCLEALAARDGELSALRDELRAVGQAGVAQEQENRALRKKLLDAEDLIVRVSRAESDLEDSQRKVADLGATLAKERELRKAAGKKNSELSEENARLRKKGSNASASKELQETKGRLKKLERLHWTPVSIEMVRKTHEISKHESERAMPAGVRGARSQRRQ
jgi:hypothetical protein